MRVVRQEESDRRWRVLQFCVFSIRLTQLAVARGGACSRTRGPPSGRWALCGRRSKVYGRGAIEIKKWVSPGSHGNGLWERAVPPISPFLVLGVSLTRYLDRVYPGNFPPVQFPIHNWVTGGA